jgi:hypothetical protein
MGIALLAAALGYLRDPPWIADITAGFRRWERDVSGERFRWTVGRATFYVPSQARSLTMPIRSGLPGPDGAPVTVFVSVDDRGVTEIRLDDPSRWVRSTVTLPTRPTRRQSRRVDLRISRTVGDQALGVQVGEVVVNP